MDTLKKIVKKILTKEIILYIVFGVLTTIVNLASFYIMTNLLKWGENLSNFIAILLAVIVAYITNKDMVFHSKALTLKKKLIEFTKFMAGRAFTMLFELIAGWLLFKLPIYNMISKGIITIIVIILNFFISKILVFNTK